MAVAFLLSYVALWALVVFQTLVLLGLVRTLHQLRNAHQAADASLVSTDGDLRGREAPAFEATALDGAHVDSAGFAGRLTALLFVSPSCASCSVTLEELEALEIKSQGNVVVICRGQADECSRLAESSRLTAPVVVDGDLEISKRFHVTAPPMALLIGPDGRIQSSGHPVHGRELEEMLASARQAQN